MESLENRSHQKRIDFLKRGERTKMQETPKTDFTDESLSSSELFALMRKANSVSEYRSLFDRYQERRKSERTRPSEEMLPGLEAQDLPEGTIKSSSRKTGRRQAEQGRGGES